MAVLSLQRRSTPASIEPPRSFFDFVVDGVSLYELTSVEERGLIGSLGWSTQKVDTGIVSSLLLKSSTDLRGSRQGLYACSVCGDIGCGAVTAEIVKGKDTYTWLSFRYENNWDSDMTQSYDSIGPFVFDATQYEAAFDVLADQVE